jgi:hypothetical protein
MSFTESSSTHFIDGDDGRLRDGLASLPSAHLLPNLPAGDPVQPGGERGSPPVEAIDVPHRLGQRLHDDVLGQMHLLRETRGREAVKPRREAVVQLREGLRRTLAQAREEPGFSGFTAALAGLRRVALSHQASPPPVRDPRQPSQG